MNIRALMEWQGDNGRHGFEAIEGEHAWVQEQITRLAYDEYHAKYVVVIWSCCENHDEAAICSCGTEQYSTRLT